MDRYRVNNRIWLGLLFFLCVSQLGCEEAKQLKLRLKKGVTYAQRVRLISDLQMFPFPGADHHDSMMDLKYEVKAVDDQGAATVRVTIDLIRASMKSLTVSASFDSNNDSSDIGSAKTSDIKQRFRRCFTGLKGAGYSAVINQQGKVISIFDVDPRIKRISTGPIIDESVGGHQAAMLLSPHHLREYVSLGMYSAWSRAQPEPEKSWVSYEPVETPRALPVMAKKTFKVDRIKKEKGDRQAVVSFTTAGALKRTLPQYAQLSGNRAQAEVEIKKIMGVGGKVTFSLSRGRLVRLQEKITAEIIFPGVGMPPRAPAAKNQPQKNERKIYYIVDKTIRYLDK